MSAGLNSVCLIGNLGKDPEVRYGQSGTAVCKFSLAVNERVKDGDDWKDHTEWFNIVCFGKTAENAGQYLKKGKQVYVSGRLRTEKYKDKSGDEKFWTSVLVNEVKFLGSKGEGEGGERPKPQAKGAEKPAGKPAEGDPPPQAEDDLGDLPF